MTGRRAPSRPGVQTFRNRQSSLWFGSAPLELRHWLIPLSLGAAVFIVVEAEKNVTRRVRAANGRRSGV